LYLWDANILRYYAQGHSNLSLRLKQVKRNNVALPSVVVAEVLRGRCEFALKSTPDQAVQAHALLVETHRMLGKFQIISFDQQSADLLIRLRQLHRSRKRYADMQIAAMAIAGNHIVVTRNTRDFSDLLKPDQVENWIDVAPRR